MPVTGERLNSAEAFLAFVGDIAGKMHLIMLHIVAQQFPYIEQKVYGIVRMGYIIAVGKPEPIMIKTENFQLLIVEISVQLAPSTHETALMQVAPNGLNERIEVHIIEMIRKH